MDPLFPAESSPDTPPGRVPNSTPNSLSDDLFDHYLAGEASAEERMAVQAVVAGKPEVVPVMKNLLGMHLERSGAVFNQSALWETLRARIETTMPVHSTAGHIVQSKRRSSGIPRAWAFAAATVLVVVAGSIGGWLSRPSSPENVTVRYTTRAEERTTLTLRDGTHVTLAPQTSLEVSRDFGVTSRTVTLTGTAYFDVPTSAGHPFVVRTGPVSTRVLGTAFTVRRYATETITQVAVASGRIAVGVNRFITLQRGDVAHVTDSTSTVLYGATLNDYTAWTSGQMSFTRTRVTDVLSTIGHWYGITFHLADSTLGTRHLTVAFNNSTRDQVLATLRELLDVRMTMQGNIITVTPRSTVHAPFRPPAPARHQHADTMFSYQRGVGR